jgi:tetratricopeptide (TPR) repeat protein
MKRLVLLAAMMNCGLAFGFAEPGGEAQSAADASAAVQGEEQQVIVVEAWRRDRALDAFLRGDFATAEVEFGKNLRCVQRNQRQFEFALRQGLIDMARGSPNAFIHSLPKHPDEIRERTCYGEEWQLYMMGLSQIQLGRFAEAKKNLKRAAHISKDDLLFDAHYRVGLLELLEGDVESANRRLVRLTRMTRSCLARRGCEVGADMEVATAYLTRAVANARHGVRR